MKTILRFAVLNGTLMFLLASYAAHAKVTPEEAARLGKDLTPLGAIRAGNAAGTIPAWDGGINRPPANYKPGMHHSDPFIADKPLFTITAANADLYKDKLSPGQLAMFRRYPKTWRMTIYPTRRSAALPQRVYDATIANATTAELAGGGNGVIDAKGGIPFPIPKTGVEALWNHILRYRGETLSQISGQVTPTAGGEFEFMKFTEDVIFPYYSRRTENPEFKNRLLYYHSAYQTPARMAGLHTLVHDFVNQVAEPRQAWTYSPGQRRVLRAPNIAYDNPGIGSDGVRTNDQYDMFNGAPDRYDWALIGRKEMYVPYNSYKLDRSDLAYDDIVRAGHVNPDLTRYELHRVWIVEGRLKEGIRHLYSRRTFYLDEDSWHILVADLYDSRGDIWRVSEAYVMNYYEVPLIYNAIESHYDLNNGRYSVNGLNNLEGPAKFNIELYLENFTPNALRRMGRR